MSSRVRNTSLRNGLSRSRYYPRRYVRPRNRYPWYGRPRTRPSTYDRYSFYRWYRDYLRRRDLLPGNNTGGDSDDNSEEEPEIPGPDLAKKLHITGVNLQINENVRKHHTNKYECVEDRPGKPAELVVRRGQEFFMTIDFNQAYDTTRHGISMSFVLKKDNAIDDDPGLEISFEVDENKNTSYRPARWGATILQNTGRSITVEVFAPATAQVGAWKLHIRTEADGKIMQYNHDEDINMLFNPWCKEDIVYLPDDVWRDESVLNDTGRLYYGNKYQMGASVWYYAQFEAGILDAAFELIWLGFKSRANRQMGSAMKVSRILAQMVNSNDENGVVVGNWSDDYSGGLSPTSWSGSEKILLQFIRTGKPVKYGQCWVFAGVLNTVCRAIGIPCRPITNFASAHNTDEDQLSCDTYYKKKDGLWVEDRYRTRDSVWNFHVWNEAWMRRPDLDGDYGGWQIIDATPQERSGGVFTCGPAPLKAVMEGAINVGEDTPFVFAEVNSDEVDWRVQPNGTVEEFSRETDEIGFNISTKQAGSETRLDVTDQYKHPENTRKERQIVEKAERLFRRNYVPLERTVLPKDSLMLRFDDFGDIQVGKDFDIKVQARNHGSASCTFSLDLKVLFKNYQGETRGTVKGNQFKKETLAAGESKYFTLSVTSKESRRQPKDRFYFSALAIVENVTSGNTVKKSLSFRLRIPDLKVEGPATVRMGDSVTVRMSFTNPFRDSISNTELEISGNLKPKNPGESHIRAGIIKGGATWTREIEMTPAPAPRDTKERSATFTFGCDQLPGVVGDFTIKLQ